MHCFTMTFAALLSLICLLTSGLIAFSAVLPMLMLGMFGILAAPLPARPSQPVHLHAAALCMEQELTCLTTGIISLLGWVPKALDRLQFRI